MSPCPYTQFLKERFRLRHETQRPRYGGVNTMQRFFLVLIAALMITSVAMATTTCPTGNYDQYTDPTSITCATNNLQFSQFGFQGGGSNPPTAASIGVMPIDILGNEGFQFNPAFNVVNGQSEDATITFE